MATATVVAQPLPALAEGWTAEKDFQAIGQLSAATQRTIEPLRDLAVDALKGGGVNRRLNGVDGIEGVRESSKNEISAYHEVTLDKVELTGKALLRGVVRGTVDLVVVVVEAGNVSASELGNLTGRATNTASDVENLHAALNVDAKADKEAAEKKAIEDTKAKKDAEEQAVRDAEAAAKADRDSAKKNKEAAKNAVKKNKRILKGSAKDANYFASGEPSATDVDLVLGDVDLVQGKIDADEMAALAGKLNGLTVAGEIKAVWSAEVKRLVDAGKLKEGEAKTLV
ncbi:hypothetical protein BN1723_005673 [Verticillium longisporum]|uniref:Ribosome-associated complex head domain-containing protein n=1 Tax=Verticillium longisporum TaxID=100787 RepID=A0A0G4N9Z6_VERLO|nr:hypothetical protein BN1723_005673 [Verticillium longisporum]